MKTTIQLLASAPTPERLFKIIISFYGGSEIVWHGIPGGGFEIHNSNGRIDGKRVVQGKGGRWRFEAIYQD